MDNFLLYYISGTYILHFSPKGNNQTRYDKSDVAWPKLILQKRTHLQLRLSWGFDNTSFICKIGRFRKINLFGIIWSLFSAISKF